MLRDRISIRVNLPIGSFAKLTLQRALDGTGGAAVKAD